MKLKPPIPILVPFLKRRRQVVVCPHNFAYRGPGSFCFWHLDRSDLLVRRCHPDWPRIPMPRRKPCNPWVFHRPRRKSLRLLRHVGVAPIERAVKAVGLVAACIRPPRRPCCWVPGRITARNQKHLLVRFEQRVNRLFVKRAVPVGLALRSTPHVVLKEKNGK